MTTDEHLETLTIEFDNNFKFDSLVAPGIYKQFQDFIHNYDALGNHLPGIYNGRYSFDASDDYDPHWIYTIGFLDFCLKEMYNMLVQDAKIKEYFDIEVRFNIMLADVNKIISESVKELL